MSSVEDACSAIASYLLSFIGTRHWEEAGCHFKIYSEMASGSQWLVNGNETDKKGEFVDYDAVWAGLDAARFLRDDLLATTGDRIWGLNFTLYPDGKFNIEYDYNKPADYEETDEVISGDEINESLSNIREDNSKD